MYYYYLVITFATSRQYFIKKGHHTLRSLCPVPLHCAKLLGQESVKCLALDETLSNRLLPLRAEVNVSLLLVALGQPFSLCVSLHKGTDEYTDILMNNII